MLAELLSLVVPSVGVVRAKPGVLRREKDAGLDQPPVPRDVLLERRFRFPAPSFEEMVRAFEVGHLLSEVFYKGGGYYDCPGEYTNTIRSTSNRVLGYIPAFHVLGSDVYRRRAVEGLDYLLGRQTPEGDFPWYYNSYGGVLDRSDGLFEAGIAGRAFVEGYRLTGDERYLEASRLTAKWETDSPISPNNNYNMFAAWHLAAHYELTGDDGALEAAVEKTRLGGIPNQLPSGGWPGHNSWMWYHGIIVRGMAELMRVLPEDHAFGPELRASLTAAINRVIRQQAGSGEIPANPRVKRVGHTCPFILHGLLLARASFGAVPDNCIHGIARYRLRRMPDEDAVRALTEAWSEYDSARAAARSAATGEVMWRADLGRFVRDVEWGEIVGGAFNCWYPCNEFDPAHQQWRRARSERTLRDAQEIVSTGARLFGGMGWTIPRGTLVPGRRYRFNASVKCAGGPSRMPLVMCSAYAGRKRPQWDPFTGCEFTRENPTFDSFSRISVAFTASADTNRVYVWAMGSEIGAGESVSIAVDEAQVTNDGLPLPDWDPALDSYDTQSDMLLLPTAVYLETMFGEARS